MDMAKKSMMSEAQDTIVDAAKTGAQGVKTVASDALGAAAAAAAGVVLDSVSKALGTGQKKVEDAAPAAQRAMQRAAGGSPRKPVAGRTAAKKRAAPKKASKKKAAKKVATGKKKSAGTRKVTGKKAAKKKKSAARRGR
jgi:hypothetical protein